MVNFKQSLTEDNTEPNTAFLNQLRSKLPEFFTKDKYDIDEDGNEVLVEEGGFDIQKFQDSLQKNNVNEITDGYTLNFVGKKYAELQAGKPTVTVVIPDMKHNSEPKNAQSENVFLTGDNLDALKHLQRAYTNSIDVIYIDPPYNTGSDGFVYNDKFDLSDEDLRDTFNMSEDEIKKLHLLNGRSSHSAWLTFMYPRLKIAQQLLKDDGVIFVSIDDNEQANLKLLMDEVFGEGNFITKFTWEKTQHFGRQKVNYYSNADYIFAFTRNLNTNGSLNEVLVEFEKTEFDDAPLFNNSNPEKELTFPAGTVRFNMKDGVYETTSDSKYKLLNSVNVKNGMNVNEFKLLFKSRWSNKKVQEQIDLGTTFWVKTSSFAIRAIYAEGKVSLESPRQIIFTNQSNPASTKSRMGQRVDTSENASKYLSKLLGAEYFSYPKPVSLIKYLISLYSQNGDFSKNITVLDFFAGSATTADAVMQLNAEDGGNRKWILNTLDEKTPDDSIAYKAGYLTIDEISRERIKRSGEKIKKEHPELERFDDGFKHYYVKEIDANTIDKIVEFDPNSIQILTGDAVSEFAGNAVKLGEYYEKSDKDRVNPKFVKVVDTGASGEDTVLQTWLINDGYKLDVPVKTLELVHHKVHYVEDGAMAYIIDQFTQEDVETLLNLIGTQQLNVKTIIVFGYSFDFSTMTSLKNNVKTALDGVRVEVRY